MNLTQLSLLILPLLTMTTSFTAARAQTPAEIRGQSARELMNGELRNRSGETLGQIEDVVVDPVAGIIVYAIVSSEERSPKGKTTRAVPFHAFEPAAGPNVGLTLDLTRASWESAPTIAGNFVHQLAQPETEDALRAFYTQHLRRGFSSDQGATKWLAASQLIGSKLTSGGRHVGDVTDVLFHAGTQRAAILLDPNTDYTGTPWKLVLSFEQFSPAGDERLETALAPADFARGTPHTTGWWDDSSGYPLAWIGSPTLGQPPARDQPPTTTASEADEPDDRPSVAAIRGRLDGHVSLMKHVHNVTVQQNGARLVVSGTVPSRGIKDDLSRTIREIADGWMIDNRLTVQSASE